MKTVEILLIEFEPLYTRDMLSMWPQGLALDHHQETNIWGAVRSFKSISGCQSVLKLLCVQVNDSKYKSRGLKQKSTV